MKGNRGEFEKWRETWSRQVLADKELDHRAARVAWFLIWYLNRETRAAFPSLSTIAAGVGIDRADASKDVDELEARGHLQKRERPGRNNEYVPVLLEIHQQGVGESPTGVGESPTPVLESPESLSSSFKGLSPPTSDIEPLIEPLNLTSDTDSDSKSESLPEQSEGEFDEVGEVKEEPAHTPSNSKPSLPSSTPPPEFRAVPPPQSKPWIAERSELAAALARFDAAHETRQQHVRANGGGHLTVGSSDAMRWRQ